MLLKGKIWEIEKNVVLLLRERIGNYFVGGNGGKEVDGVNGVKELKELRQQSLWVYSLSSTP